MQRVLRALPRQMSALSWAARRAFEDAVGAALRGEPRAAAAALAEALRHDPEVAAGRLIAARIRYAVREYQGALDELDVATKLGADAQADEIRYAFAIQLGWNHEAREVIERRIHGRDSSVWRGRAIQLFGRLRHYGAALDHVESLIAVSKASAPLALSAADLAARIGAHAKVRVHASSAAALASDRAPLRTAAAMLLAASGFADDALAQAEATLGQSPPTAAHDVFAELSLWTCNLEQAAEHARLCSPASRHRVQGALAVLSGAHEQALVELDEALCRDPTDTRAHAWRAEALLRLGRCDEATHAADRAILCADGHPVAAHAIRLLAGLYAEQGATLPPGSPSLGEIQRACGATATGAATLGETSERDAAIKLLESALESYAGNRGDRPTWLDDGALRPVSPEACAGFATRTALDLLRIEAPSVALAALDEAVQRHPDSPLPLVGRARARLWLGDCEAARRDLELAMAIDPRAPSVYVGSMALENLCGRHEEALAICALGAKRLNGVPPAAHLQRGEAHRRLGRLEAAVEDLEAACTAQPVPLGATINLALAHVARGDEDAARELYATVARRAPGLLSDAALAAGLEPLEAWNPATPTPLLESALELMRGNRSSRWQTYVGPRGAFRSVPEGSNGLPEIDRREAEALKGVQAWLNERLAPSERRSRARSGEPIRDVEIVALSAGLRTAVRVAVPAAQIEAVRRRHADAGMVSLVAPVEHEYGAERLTIVYAGRTEAAARRALEAERDLDPIALGKMLGYPACCIEGFVRTAPNHQFDAARAAWVPRPLPRLNVLLFGLGVRFISFEPCRFDCPSAARVADDVANALALVSPSSTTRCDIQLAQAVAIDSRDARARVTLDRSNRIHAAEPVQSTPEGPFGQDAIALSQRLIGARVEDDGRVLVEGSPETIVCDFGWPTRGL